MNYDKAIRELEAKIKRQRENLEASQELRAALIAIQQQLTTTPTTKKEK